MMLGGCTRLPTGELVPRRSPSELRNLLMLSSLVGLGGVDLSEVPEPAPILLGTTFLEGACAERELVSA